MVARAATALAAGETIPWDAELVARAEAQTERMGGEGRRVMAAATTRIDARQFGWALLAALALLLLWELGKLLARRARGT